MMDQVLWCTYRKTALVLPFVFWCHNGTQEQLYIMVEPNPVLTRVQIAQRPCQNPRI